MDESGLGARHRGDSGETESLLHNGSLDSTEAGKGSTSGGTSPPQRTKIMGVAIDRAVLGFAYILVMSVCGMVMVALGVNLNDLAVNVGTTSVQIGSVFVVRGCGSVTGAIVSAKLYTWFNGNNVMSVSLLCLGTFLLIMPYLTSSAVLHVFYGCCGLCTAITDTGCQIMTRRVHGIEAGPWLSANTLSFSLSGALVPLMEYITGNLIVRFAVFSTAAIGSSVLLFVCPSGPISAGMGKKPKAGAPGKGAPAAQSSSFAIEWTISFMVFWLIGGQVTLNAYLKEYCDGTGVVSTDQSGLVLAVMWMFVTVGRLAGIYMQKDCSTQQVYKHLNVLLGAGSLGMSLVLLNDNLEWLLWVSVGIYGLTNGPTIGYAYDLNNRITRQSEKGMAIVMFGLNFGASIVPFASSMVYDATGPMALVAAVFMSMLLPLPALHLTRFLRQKNESLPGKG